MTGCARTIRTNIRWPAQLNLARYGSSLEVAEFAGPQEGALRAVTALRSSIAADAHFAQRVRVVSGHGALRLKGTVLRYSERDQDVQRSSWCSRVIMGGRFGRTISYPCSRQVTVATATVAVAFTLSVAQTEQLLFTRVFDAQLSIELSRNGWSATDQANSRWAERQRLRNEAIDQTVSQFTHTIMPWSESTEIAMDDCAGDTICTQSYQQLLNGRVAEAERLLTVAMTAQGPADRLRDGGRYYNRAMLRWMQGHVALALADLREAVALCPDRAAWSDPLLLLGAWVHDRAMLRAEVRRSAQAMSRSVNVTRPQSSTR